MRGGKANTSIQTYRRQGKMGGGGGGASKRGVRGGEGKRFPGGRTSKKNCRKKGT